MATGSRFPKLEFRRSVHGRPLPTGIALIDYWRGTGEKGRAAHSGDADRGLSRWVDQRGSGEAKAGYEAHGGGFNNALGRLRTLELVQGRGELKASDNLFDTRAI